MRQMGINKRFHFIICSNRNRGFYNNNTIFFNTLSNLLCNLKNRGAFDKLTIMKPFSFVLVDDDKETIAELLLLDDDTLLVNEELLKGLDEELDAFLKDLLEK